MTTVHKALEGTGTPERGFQKTRSTPLVSRNRLKYSQIELTSAKESARIVLVVEQTMRYKVFNRLRCERVQYSYRFGARGKVGRSTASAHGLAAVSGRIKRKGALLLVRNPGYREACGCVGCNGICGGERQGRGERRTSRSCPSGDGSSRLPSQSSRS